jgi:type II secretory pathway component GspD/PulD (secretin)
VGSEDARISVQLDELPVVDAMRMLSDATNFNILVSSTVQGKITAYVVDMEPERALKEIMEVNGFHYVREDDVVWVLSDEEYFEDFNLGRKREIVALKNASAEYVAQALQPVMSAHGVLMSYPQGNVLIIGEVESRMDEVLRLAKELDQPTETRVFQLQSASALDVLSLLYPHVQNKEGLQADQRTNQIMVSAPPETLARIEDLIIQFDVPDKIATKVFPLKYANADEVARLVLHVLTGEEESTSRRGGWQQSTDSGRTAPRVFTTEPRGPSAATPETSWRRYTERQAPTTPPAGESAASKQPTPATAPQSPQAREDAALGPLANVTADTRTNSVIVTHVKSVIERVGQIIEAIDVPTEYQTYTFRNAHPAELDLEAKILPLLPAENPFLNVEPLSRTVTFRAPKEKASEIVALLQQWDDVIRQVRIEAEILRVNVNLIRELGISWEAIADQTRALGEVNQVGVSVDFPANIGDDAPQSRLTVGDLGDDDYEAILQALASDSDTQIIASPRIMVRDSQEALFSSVRDEPYTVVSVEGETGTRLEDVRFLNVGVTLNVLPVINENGQVSLTVQLEISSLVEIRNGVPVVDRATAQSSVAVDAGGTVILGGLRQRSRSQVERGVPGLKRIPILGHLFKNTRNDDGEFEIVLILRPTLVNTHEENVPTISLMGDYIGSAIKQESLGEETLEE